MNNATQRILAQANETSKKLNPHIFRTCSEINHPTTQQIAVKALLQKKKLSQTEKLRNAFKACWSNCKGCELLEEYQFHPERRWRFDLCAPSIRVAIEIDGGIFSNGGHNRGGQITKDYEKRNSALSLGWHVFQLTTIMMTPEYINPIARFMDKLLYKKIQ